jgi:hypothetical protein
MSLILQLFPPVQPLEKIGIPHALTKECARMRRATRLREFRREEGCRHESRRPTPIGPNHPKQ